MPLWLVREKSRSTHRGDPVHHFGRFAFLALMPLAIYDLARIPTYLLFDSP